MNFVKLTLFVIFFTGILSSCNKEEPPIPYWGDASAQLNGRFHEYYPSAEMNADEETFTLSLRDYSDEWILEDHFFINNIPLKEGTYYFNSPAQGENSERILSRFLTLQANSETSYNTYNMSDQDTNSFVKVEKIKEEKIWGTFQVQLFRDSLSDTSTPEVYNFGTGEFKTKVL